MKHKIPLFILFLLLLTPALHAQYFQYGDLYYNVTDETARTVEVTYGNYSGLTKAIIPETVMYNSQTYSVTSIGIWVFNECTSLTEVVIGNSVTSIGKYAFCGCIGLTEVVIPNSVTSVGNWAFSNCTGLTEVVIPNSVTTIGGGAFSGCSGLQSIVVADGNSVYDSRENCNAIIETATNTLIAGCQTTTIPNSVTSIEGGAFSGCSGLTEIVIPESVTSIGRSAFSGCSSLKSIVVAEGNSVYDSRENCNAIIETATNTLIAGCQTTTIPNSVTSIGEYAFYGCSGLTEIVIPNSVTSIGEYAFYGCSSLMEVVIGESVTSIGNHAFRDCSGLKSVTWNAIACGDFSYYYGERPFPDCSSLTSFTFGAQVTYIPAYLCYGLSGLTEVVIPEKVRSIGWSAFSGCSGLMKVTIGNSVRNIESEAFSGCNALTEVVIPNSVTSIGYEAFRDCSGLTKAMIGNGVTTIESKTFSGCSGLTEVTIGAGVRNIGRAAFYDCRRLQSVTSLATTPPTIYVENGSETFGNIPRYTILYVYEQYLDDYKFSDWSLFFGDLRPIADQETGLEDVYGEGNGAAEGDRAADGVGNGAPRKVMRDGKLLIIHGEETYTATGVRIQ